MRRDLTLSLIVVELIALFFVIPVAIVKTIIVGALAFTIIATFSTIVNEYKASYDASTSTHTYRFPVLKFAVFAVVLLAITFGIKYAVKLIASSWMCLFLVGIILLAIAIAVCLKLGKKALAVIFAFGLMTVILLWAIFANGVLSVKDLKVDKLYVNEEYVTNQTVETQNVTEQNVDKSNVTEQNVETQNVTDQNVDNSNVTQQKVENQVVDTQVVIEQTVIETKVPEETKAPEETKKPEETKPVHTHKYTSVVTEPTCTDKGYTTYTCTCGDSYKDNYKDAIGHDYKEEVVKATTEAGGYTVHKCTRCGDSYTDNITDKLPKPKNPKLYVSSETMQKGDTVIVTIVDAEVSDVLLQYADPNTGAWTTAGVSLVHVSGNNYRLVVDDSLFDMAVDVTVGLKSLNNYMIVTLEPSYN